MTKESITEPGLLQLKEHTKNVMLPLLIKIFQLRSEASQLQDPPSRLRAFPTSRSLGEITKQLKLLDKDLQLQQIWIESSRAQIEKILSEIEKNHAPSSLSQLKVSPSTHPGIQKSFQNVVSSLCSSHLPRRFSLRSLWKKFFW